MLSRMLPRTTTAQMMALLCVSYISLLTVLTIFEYLENNSVTDMALSEATYNRISRITPILMNMQNEEASSYLSQISHCHEGYSLTKVPFSSTNQSVPAPTIASTISNSLDAEIDFVRASFVNMTQSDFDYSECDSSEMRFPFEGMVLSLRITQDTWLNTEIHPHEWHLTPQLADWFLRSSIAFLIIGAVALLFIRRMHQPLKKLTEATRTFASELRVTEIEESGPSDIKDTIATFNSMQRQVIEGMETRGNTLAAISHDIRSPLTALRIKAELVDDERVRDDLIASIEKMEKITSSALDFLRGESRNEPKKQTDLRALVESECVEFRDRGERVDFDFKDSIHVECRPQALARAVSNLIDNAVKYAGSAYVSISDLEIGVEISVCDTGPGISVDQIEEALKPFGRLSEARESKTGGFGLGLAIVESVAKGHDGSLSLKQNSAAGLIATIHLNN
jgi:signal transduction histidine kinase